MVKETINPLYGIPFDKWYDIEYSNDVVVSDHELLCRNLTIDGNFMLIGNLFCNNITIKGNCTIYGSILNCTNVKVTGSLSLFENPFLLRGIRHTGGFFAPHGDVEIGGDLVCEYGIRTGTSRFKVSGNVNARIIECKGISIAGDCYIYPDTIWSEVPVYVLGDVRTGFPIESEVVFCGGTYTYKFNPHTSTTIVYENFKDWNTIKEVLHE